MKKIYIYLFALSLSFISGCSKDFLKSFDRRIVGIWHISDVNTTGLGGDQSNLPFKEGEFTFSDDGTLTYVNNAGTTYTGTWNIERKNYNESVYQSLEITAVNFSNQAVISEYYDDIDFTRSDHFKAKIEQGLHTYVTHFRK
jgi:hypothetical protein